MSGPGSETWPESTDANPRTGGATWTSYTLDADRGLLYVPAGNPAPDFDVAARPGLNLYTNSIVILNARTGKLDSFYQLIPNDFHDWDVDSAPALITTANGTRMLAEAAKDGHLYTIDLDAGKVLYNVPVTRLSNTTAPLTAEGTHFCPGTQGGVEWNGAAWHPGLNTLFVGASDACSTVKLLANPPAAKSAAPLTNGSGVETPFGTLDPKSEWRGWLTAVDADSGKVIWKYQGATPLLAGVTATAGNLVFTGDLNGNFFAFDAKTGKQLYHDQIGQPIAGGVVTYAVDNTQYVAVAAGMTSKTWKTTGEAEVVVYSLK
jgi:alcohol dehydrogenase (cytochrome c)